MSDTRHQLNELARRIERSIARDPFNYRDREPLWMEREALRRKHLNR